MKKTTFLLITLLISSSNFAQDLFSDNFEAGINNWTVTSTGTNGWVVNSSYTGFSTFIPDTPQQPAAITNSPESEYLHIMNSSVCSQFSACNANFDASNSSIAYAELTNSISTVGYLNTEISFYYLCAGAAGNSFGELEYSTDNGGTWTSTGTEYSATATWTLETVSMPAWNDVSQLKFRFKWENNSQGSDPAFAIDDLSISAEQDVTGISEIHANSFKVFPNPSNDVINISANEKSEISKITIVSLDGKSVLGTYQSQNQIDIQHLDAGVYLLKILSNGAVTTMRIVKK